MSLDRCPGCRARLVGEALSCQRCGCDLALVRQVEQHAQAALGRALRAWAGGDVPEALVHARVAQALHGEPLTASVVRCLAGLDVEATPRTRSPASAVEGWGEGEGTINLTAPSFPPAAPSPA